MEERGPCHGVNGAPSPQARFKISQLSQSLDMQKLCTAVGSKLASQELENVVKLFLNLTARHSSRPLCMQDGACGQTSRRAWWRCARVP